jgi:hypothetical protein
MARMKLRSRLNDPSLKPACSLSERTNTRQKSNQHEANRRLRGLLRDETTKDGRMQPE